MIEASGPIFAFKASSTTAMITFVSKLWEEEKIRLMCDAVKLEGYTYRRAKVVLSVPNLLFKMESVEKPYLVLPVVQIFNGC